LEEADEEEIQRFGSQVLGLGKCRAEVWQAQELSMICVAPGRVMVDGAEVDVDVEADVEVETGSE
jgi:hypothetical protein